MNEWFGISGLSAFIIGAIVVVDRYSGITGNVISDGLGQSGSIIGPVFLIIGLALLIAGFRKKD